MGEIRVPKVNANDATYILVQWLTTDGAWVSPGDPVAVVETSKANEEIAAEAAGIVHILTPSGAECHPGQTIARLHAADERQRSATAAASPPANGERGDPPVAITAPAQALLEEHGLDIAAVQAQFGRRVVRRGDIEALILDAGRAPSTPPPEPARVRKTLPLVQQAVADVVTESHRTVPAAFVAVQVRADQALALARQLSRQHRCLIGLPELLIKAIAAQHADFPLCFAHLIDPATVGLAEAAHVGLTVDVGSGLRVPVVHHAARLSWHQLGTTLMGLRAAAMRGRLRAGDFTGGNILVALHNDQDVTVAVPLVYPGQTCAVSLAATQSVLALDAEGSVHAERVVQVGLAYDHRVISGSVAVAFLQALKRLLGSPRQLAALGEEDSRAEAEDASGTGPGSGSSA